MKMDVINDLSQLSPGFLDQLDQLMGPAGDSCGYLPPPDARRIGSHQLPESPPDSGSENPYSPSDTIAHSIPVSQSVLNQDYMLVQDHIQHEILQQNGEYMYEELKSDSLDHDVLRNNLNDVVVLPQDANLMELGLRSVRHDIGLNDYQNRYGQMRVEMPELDQGIMNPQLLSIGHEPLTPAFTSLQEPSSKKRKHSSDVNSQVKCEPVLSPESLSPLQGGSAPRAAPSVDGSEAGDEAPFQCIRFASFQQTPWHCLYDQHLKPLTPPSYVVGADKGFNFSQIDEAFVCQKKNHFQVTCQIHMQGDAHYVKAGDGAKKINSFYLHFYGVKAEDPSQEVRVEQSQSDRTKKPFHPVPVELRREGTKLTVGRLHFAETTNNNMRKKGRPNPDQRHFQLVVALKAHCQHTEYMIAAAASDKIIVRASNPGQFESDCTENWWQRGVLDNSVHFNGRVGINTDRPDESCVINGNLKVMGHIIQPSDARAKHNIEELDTAQQLKNVQSIRVVKFNYDPSFAEHSGLLGFDPRSSAPSSDTGVIAQEVKRIIPEAVKEAGDVTLPDGNTIYKFLFVNKDRIFMENIGAVKELCKVTGKLESRIDQLERTNKKLCKISVLQRRDSARSSISNDSRYSAASSTCKSMYSDGNISNEHIRDIARNIRKHEYCHKLSHNSPKYTRKQCKCCKEHHPHKYGKHYNANKTNTVRYHSSKHDMESPDNMHFSPNFDTLASNKTRESAVQPTENYSTMTKSKDTCLWVKNRERENSFVCGNTNFGFCCRKKDKMYGDGGVELISNKFLQIVITVLIFIMAVCLVVMSVLYFKEHQELVSIKDMRLRSHSTLYASNYGKFANMHTPPPRATPPGPDNGYPNLIQNSKHLQHVAAKKTAKEKGTHKTTPEYITAPPIVTPPQTTPLHASKNYVKNGLNMDPQSPPIPHVEHRLSISRDAEVVGSGCALENVLNAELDADCQSSCNLDPPQAYDNQEPLEKTNQDKEFNETSNFARAIDPLPNERPPVVRMIEERNNTDAYKSENDSLKKQLHDEINIAESNFLDPSKIILLSDNVTKNETPRRLKRVAGDAKGSSRSKRETNEALLRSSSEEMFLTEQSDEIGGMKDCDKVSFGVKSKTFANESMFEETICANAFSNLTYIVPVSKCLREKNIIIGFKSSKLRQLRLCNLQCKYDTTKGCQMNRDIARPQAEKDGAWTSRMTLECNMDREMTVRAAFVQQKDLCYLTSDQKVPFVEYNIRIFRDCRN